MQDRNTREDIKLARKMICFTESQLSVKHQLQLLKCSGSTHLKIDLIQSLVSSASLEAIEGLIDVADRACQYGAEDVRNTAIAAVYAVRESSRPDILISSLIDKAEEEFFEKVRQKLEWTDESPDLESRRYGWISDEEFIFWLKQEKRNYQSSQGEE